MPVEQNLVQGQADIAKHESDELSTEVWLSERLKSLAPKEESAPSKESKTAEVTEPSKQEQDRDEQGKFKGKEEKPEDEKVTPGVQKRIDKAIAKQRDAERRAEEAERRLQEKQVTPPAKETAIVADLKAPVKPDRAKYDDWEKYENDKDKYYEDFAEYKAKVTLESDRKSRAEAEAKAKAEEEGKKHAESWDKSVEKVREAHDDYDEKLSEVQADIKAGKLPGLSSNTLGAITASDSKAELLYYLMTNQDEYKRIAALPIHMVGYALGKIEAKLEPKEKPVPEEKDKPKKKVLPTPPEPVTGKAAASSGPSEEDSPEVWAAKRTKQRQAQGHNF